MELKLQLKMRNLLISYLITTFDELKITELTNFMIKSLFVSAFLMLSLKNWYKMDFRARKSFHKVI